MLTTVSCHTPTIFDFSRRSRHFSARCDNLHIEAEIAFRDVISVVLEK